MQDSQEGRLHMSLGEETRFVEQDSLEKPLIAGSENDTPSEDSETG